MIEAVRPSVGCAVTAMVSYSIVHRKGTGEFMSRAAAAGFDGVILPDVPVEESAPMREAAQRADLAYVGLVAPTTTARRRKAIASASSGFVYQIATAGTTGERGELSSSLADDVAELKGISGLPVCVGFGVSSAEQVGEVCGICDGAIVGSAIVRRALEAMADGLTGPALVDRVSEFLQNLADAADGTSR
jgi:tryptophan synthase alpha chain